MARLSDEAQLDIANKIAAGITSTNSNRNLFEESLPWQPTITVDDIWGETVTPASSRAAADVEAAATAGIVTKLTQYIMDEVPLSNEQAWATYDTPGDVSSTRLVDWINPHLFGAGYFAELFQNDDSPIAYTDGRYQIDYKNGVVRFDAGYTPADLGLLTPLKITIYRFTGIKGLSALGITGEAGTTGQTGATGPQGAAGSGAIPHQEELVTENISGADVTLSDTLTYEVANPEGVSLYLNKVFQVQGAGRDYVLSGTAYQEITWLASSGTAVSMATTDELVAVYNEVVPGGSTGNTGYTGPTGPTGIGATGPTGPSGAVLFPRQEIIPLETTELPITTTGGDQTLVNGLTYIPDPASVRMFINRLFHAQGAGLDYTLGGTDNKAITILVGSGTAPDLDASDTIVVVYLSYD